MDVLGFGVGPAGRESWEPDAPERFGKQLSSLLGRPVETRVAESYVELLDRLRSSQTQLAWLPPAVFARAEEEYGARMVATCVRMKTLGYRGVLFVRSDSTMNEPEDLAGSSVAWVDPASAAGYLYPRWTLLRHGLDPRHLFRQEKMLGTHGSVVRAVDTGEVDVGATYLNLGPSDADPPLARSTAGWTALAASDRFRPVLVSPLIPNDVICCHHGMAPTECHAISEILFRFHRSEQGADILEGLFQAARFGPGRSADYATVRAALRLIP
jgi:phosphonate transport system substrate-binding protein